MKSAPKNSAQAIKLITLKKSCSTSTVFAGFSFTGYPERAGSPPITNTPDISIEQLPHSLTATIITDWSAIKGEIQFMSRIMRHSNVNQMKNQKNFNFIKDCYFYWQHQSEQHVKYTWKKTFFCGSFYFVRLIQRQQWLNVCWSCELSRGSGSGCKLVHMKSHYLWRVMRMNQVLPSEFSRGLSCPHSCDSAPRTSCARWLPPFVWLTIRTAQ